MNEIIQEADKLDIDGNPLGRVLRWHRQARLYMAIIDVEEPSGNGFGYGHVFAAGFHGDGKGDSFFYSGDGYGDGFAEGDGDGEGPQSSYVGNGDGVSMSDEMFLESTNNGSILGP